MESCIPGGKITKMSVSSYNLSQEQGNSHYKKKLGKISVIPCFAFIAVEV